MHKFKVGQEIYIIKSTHDRDIHRYGRILRQLPGNNQSVAGYEEDCYEVQTPSRVDILPESYIMGPGDVRIATIRIEALEGTTTILASTSCELIRGQ